MNPVDPIPAGFHTVTPYLRVPARSAPGLLDFLARALGALELGRLTLPDGTTAHAQVRIGDSIVMIGEARRDCAPTSACLYLYVVDVDEAYQRAVREGGVSIMPPADQYYGDRTAGVTDPCGNTWWMATHKEDVSSEELQRRVLIARG